MCFVRPCLGRALSMASPVETLQAFVELASWANRLPTAISTTTTGTDVGQPGPSAVQAQPNG